MHRARSRRRLDHAAFGSWLVLLALVGCGSTQSPEPDPDPPAGGDQFVLDYARFASTVAPILAAEGCDAGGDCHGGGIRGSYELSPADDKDAQFDFEQTALQVAPYALLESAILRKPLAESAGGVPHSVKPFASTDDPGYQAILGWLEEGEFR